MDNKLSKICDNCKNSFICPTYRSGECCDGFNNEKVFVGLLKLLMFGRVSENEIDKAMHYIQKIQNLE